MQISDNISGQFMLHILEDFIQLFFYDKDLKKVVFESQKLKDQDEKDFRKFITNITQPIIDELGKILLKVNQTIDIEILSIILQTIYKDFK